MAETRKIAAMRTLSATAGSRAPTPQFAPFAIGAGSKAWTRSPNAAGATPIIVRRAVSKLVVTV